MKQKLLLSYDIGATWTKWAILDFETLEILKVNNYATEGLTKGGSHICSRTSNHSSQILNEYPNIVGIAIATAGIVDSKLKIITHTSDTIKGYVGADWGQEYKRFNLPTSLLNDCNAAAVAEHSENELDNFILLAVGSGVGAGIFINNHLFQGNHYFAGEIGQWQDISDPTLSIDDSCSLVRLLNKAAEILEINNCSISQFINYKKTNKKIKIIYQQWIKNIALLINQLFLAYDPQKIVIGGGMAHFGEDIFIDIKKSIKKYAKFSNHLNLIELEFAKAKNQSAIIGAAIQWKSENI